MPSTFLILSLIDLYHSVCWRSTAESGTHAWMLHLPGRLQHYSSRLPVQPSSSVWPLCLVSDIVRSQHVWLVSVSPPDPGTCPKSTAVSDGGWVTEGWHILRWTLIFAFLLHQHHSMIQVLCICWIGRFGIPVWVLDSSDMPSSLVAMSCLLPTVVTAVPQHEWGSDEIHS